MSSTSRLSGARRSIAIGALAIVLATGCTVRVPSDDSYSQGFAAGVRWAQGRSSSPSLPQADSQPAMKLRETADKVWRDAEFQARYTRGCVGARITWRRTRFPSSDRIFDVRAYIKTFPSTPDSDDASGRIKPDGWVAVVYNRSGKDVPVRWTHDGVMLTVRRDETYDWRFGVDESWGIKDPAMPSDSATTSSSSRSPSYRHRTH